MDAKDTFGLNDDGTVTTALAWQLSLSFFFCVCDCVDGFCVELEIIQVREQASSYLVGCLNCELISD